MENSLQASFFHSLPFLQIFESAGSQLSSTVENIIVATVQVAGTSFGAVVIDKLGRKPLIILSGVLMCVSEVALGRWWHFGLLTTTLL